MLVAGLKVAWEVGQMAGNGAEQAVERECNSCMITVRAQPSRNSRGICPRTCSSASLGYLLPYFTWQNWFVSSVKQMVWLIFFPVNQPLTWSSCKHRLSVQLRSGHVSSAPADWAQRTFWERGRRQFKVYYCLGKEKNNKAFMFWLWERNFLLAWGVDIRNWSAWLFAICLKPGKIWMPVRRCWCSCPLFI